MTTSRRRLVILIATAVALICGAGAFIASSQSAGADASGPSPAVAVLSPRRAPVVLRNLIADTRLASRVEALMRSLPSTSCVVVRADQDTLASINPDQPLISASALKLTTAAAFLSKLGGQARFETVVWHPAVESGTVSFLGLEGDGDPLLATAGYVETRKHPPKPFTDVTKLAQRLHDAGIRRVSGAIIVDDSKFDRERRVPSWSAGYTTTGDVGPIGALSVNDGFSAYAPHLIAAADPALAAGEQLRSDLAALGVAVDGGVRRGSIPDTSRKVSVRSPVYADIVREMLTESDNNTAEALLRALTGRVQDAARADGAAARTRALAALGIDTDEIKAIDGSGLDRSDRASCSALLQTLTSHPGGYDLADMLAVAGKTGTLDDRFLTSPLVGKLRAKTGSLNGVTALVGEAVADPAAPLFFAFIANGAFSDEGGKALQDRLVAALATYPEAPAALTLAP